jgi:ribonuclease HII
MKCYLEENELEAGIDEVARGCLFGRVYTAVVIWHKENDPQYEHPIMKDSKQLSKKRREEMEEYIKDFAIDYKVSYEDEKTVDKINILQATYKSMHNGVRQLEIEPDSLLVDGDKFKPYVSNDGSLKKHTCIIAGDTKFYAIASASILAKVAHDRYITELCKQYPELDERYDLLSNMGYGTSKHIAGIKKYGICQFHRKTFGLCRDAKLNKVID